MVKIVAALIFFIIVGALAFQILGRYVFRYRITKDSLQFVVFGKIPYMSIKLANIAEIREVSFKEATFQKPLVWRCGNRLWGKIVLIRRKKGIIKTILITPDNPDEFISEIRESTRTQVIG
jgi:hypothetical protein